MQNASSKKMGVMPVPKLLFIMSAPAILSMFVQAMYNVTDSIFVSRVSEDALTALSLSFPLQMFVLAFSLGVGIGSASLISRRLGQGNPDEASKTARNGLFLALCLAAFWAVFGFLVAKIFTGFYAEKGSEIYNLTQSYLIICITFSIGSVFEIYFTRLMQSMGSMIIPMLTQLLGAVINIALDPLLIFGLGKLPALGVRGAAIATVIGQTVAMIFAVVMFFRKKTELNLSMKKFRPEGAYIKDIIKLGLPVTILNSVSSVATTAMNAILISINKTAVAVLGAHFKLQSFVIMPAFGLNQGALPIMAYNYGANNKKRFMKTYGICLCAALVFMIAGVAIFHTCARQLLTFFEASDEMLNLGERALRIISISLIPAAFSIVTINMFQSLGHGFKSMLMSILRQLGFLLPIALILSRTAGIDYVWISYPIADILTISVFTPIAVKTVKSAFRKLNEDNELIEQALLTEKMEFSYEQIPDDTEKEL